MVGTFYNLRDQVRWRHTLRGLGASDDIVTGMISEGYDPSVINSLAAAGASDAQLQSFWNNYEPGTEAFAIAANDAVRLLRGQGPAPARVSPSQSRGHSNAGECDADSRASCSTVLPSALCAAIRARFVVGPEREIRRGGRRWNSAIGPAEALTHAGSEFVDFSRFFRRNFEVLIVGF